MSKPHGKSMQDLARMKMSELLKLVKNHNLAKHIHLYRRMKKAELVQSLAKYKSSVPSLPASSRTVTIGMKSASSPQKLVVQQVAAAPRVRKPAPVKKTKKVVKTTAKSTKARRNPSLYTKAEGGVAGGALADFERVYGKMASPKKPSAKQGVPALGKRQRRKPKQFIPK